MEDLRPLDREERTWKWQTYAAMWAATAFQPGNYSFGGSLMALGLSPLEGLVITALGSCLVAFFIVLNSAPGVALGVPFPVYARASFGIHGAKVAAISRGVVGVCWLSFQLWVGGLGLVQGITAVYPDFGKTAMIWDPYLNVAQLFGLLASAAACCLCISVGVDHFDKFLYFATPLGFIFFVFVTVWLVVPSWGGHTFVEEMHEQTTESASMGGPDGAVDHNMARLIGLNAFVSVWSAIMMNASDLSRLASRQAEQAFGQAVGIPLPTVYIVLVGILGAAWIKLETGEVSWMMSDLLSHWHPMLALLGGIIVFVLTLAVNVTANIIPPANDFMNLMPHSLKWRACAYGAVFMALLLCPFVIFHSPSSMVTKFLAGYGMVTGALYGVMVSDYFVVRRGRISLQDLYPTDKCRSAFEYANGHNWRAILASLVAVALPFPAWAVGLFGDIDASDLPMFFKACGDASWFVSAFTSAALYLVCCMLCPPPKSFPRATELCPTSDLEKTDSDLDNSSTDNSNSATEGPWDPEAPNFQRIPQLPGNSRISKISKSSKKSLGSPGVEVSPSLSTSDEGSSSSRSF
mmetsp:Transcript_43228/g.92470  ORF Transcript_43228/g.92470 Transcript_43228/m.92470 type:complete len:577 (+) Transcript_43228:190-1920(+)